MSETVQTRTIDVEVVYAAEEEVVSRRVLVKEGATLETAIARSLILERFREIDLRQNKVGIFGNLKKLDAPLKAGDRVEIYRPITCDPDSVPRRDVSSESQSSESQSPAPQTSESRTPETQKA